MKKIVQKILPVTVGAAALAQEYESNIGSCSVYGCTWSFTTTCNVYTTNMHIFLMSCPNMRD